MAMRDHHQNRLFLPDVTLPAGIQATIDLDEALAGAHVVVVAVPAQHVRAVMARAAPWIAHGSLVVSVTKGIEASSAKRMTEVLAEVLPGVDPGPSACWRARTWPAR